MRHIITRTQTFLRGHDNEISVITVSKSGKFIASGQKTYMGFQADIIIWNFEDHALMHRLKLHKVIINSLSFCCNELYLASQGGQDDKNMMIVWDVQSGKALYGSPNREIVHQIKFFNRNENKLIAIQDKGVQILTVDKDNKKVIII